MQAPLADDPAPGTIAAEALVSALGGTPARNKRLPAAVGVSQESEGWLGADVLDVTILRVRGATLALALLSLRRDARDYRAAAPSGS
jgi:hypothetical protein